METIPKKRIGIIHDSDSNLPKMLKGFKYLKQQEAEGSVVVTRVDSTSGKCHIPIINQNLKAYHNEPTESRPDVLIVVSSREDDLARYCEEYLRYTLGNNSIRVFRVISDNEYDGFFRSCVDAVAHDFPEIIPKPMPAVMYELPKITLKTIPPDHRRSLATAISVAEEKCQKS